MAPLPRNALSRGVKTAQEYERDLLALVDELRVMERHPGCRRPATVHFQRELVRAAMAALDEAAWEEDCLLGRTIREVLEPFVSTTGET